MEWQGIFALQPYIQLCSDLSKSFHVLYVPLWKIVAACHYHLPFYCKGGTTGISDEVVHIVELGCEWTPHVSSQSVLHLTATLYSWEQVILKWYKSSPSGFDSQIKWCSSKRVQEGCGRKNQHSSLLPWISSARSSGKQWQQYTDGVCPIQAFGFFMAEGSIAENKEQGEMSLMMDGWNQVICSRILNWSHNHVSFKYLMSHTRHTRKAHLRPYLSLIRPSHT